MFPYAIINFKMNKLISVIVPVYNSEKTIERCVNSLAAQTDENFEVILINDGSTDKTEEILKDFCRKNKHFKLISKKNGGAAAARNTGIDKAEGEYICFVDSDDIASPNYLKHLRSMMTDGVDVACAKYARNKKSDFEEIKDDKNILSNQDAINALLRMEIDNSPFVKLISKKIVGEIRMPNVPVAEDLYFNYLVFKKAKKVAAGESILYSYSRVEGSLSTKEFSVDRMQSLEVVQKIDDGEKSFYSKARLFMEAYFICELIVLSNATESCKAEYDKVCGILNENRKDILNNKMATMRQRLIAAALKFGPKFTVKMMTSKNAIRKKVGLN